MTDEAHPISTAAAPQTGRVLAFVAGGLVVLLGTGFALAMVVRRHGDRVAEGQAAAVADARTTVDVVDARPTAKTYPLALPGQTAGWYQSTIYARVDGYVGHWSADLGDPVRRGQVLATIETPELDQQAAAAGAKASASTARVDVAASDVSIARLTDARWRDSPKGVVSDQEREEKRATLTAAVARLAEAKAQARLDAADVARYAALESFKDVTAPYDGVVTARHVDIGDLVTAGGSASTSPLYAVAQSNTIRVFVDVPQKAAAEAVPGIAARVTADPYPGRTFAGRVARSAMSIDPATRTEQVEVDVPNPDLALVPGMYCRVTFDLNQLARVQVPAAAMLFRPTGLQVAIVGPAGTVDFRPVTIAQDNGDTVELADGPVRPGDRVALNLGSDVTQGEHVDAVSVPSAVP